MSSISIRQKNNINSPPSGNINFACQILGYLFIIQKNQKKPTLENINDYFSKGKIYTDKAIALLRYFNIIVFNKNDNKVFISDDTLKKIDGTYNKSISLLKSKIVQFKPYIEYYYYQSIGKTIIESTKLVEQIYFPGQDQDKISNIFEYWSKYLNIDNKVKYSKKLNLLVEYDSYFNNQLSAQKFIREQFGNNYKTIHESVISDIIEAFNDYKSDPSKAVNDAGRGLEDFLRLDFGVGIDLSNFSGVVQIANELVNKSIITSKHQSILSNLGNIRSMGDAHGVDKKTKEKWTVLSSSALHYTFQILSIINSLSAYKNHSTLVY